MALLCAACLSAAAHGVHASRTVVDYLSATGEVQITMTVPAADLEEFLRFETKRQLELDRDKDADAIVFDNVKRWLQFQDAKGAPIDLKWVGMEVKATYVTIFVEARTKLFEGGKVRNVTLLEWDSTWTNQVIIRRNQTGATSDHQFKKGQTGFSSIRFPSPSK
jgi:hypothetical protein